MEWIKQLIYSIFKKFITEDMIEEAIKEKLENEAKTQINTIKVDVAEIAKEKLGVNIDDMLGVKNEKDNT